MTARRRHALFDEPPGHVFTDDAAEEVDHTDEHGFETRGDRRIAVTRDAFLNPFDVWIASQAKRDGAQ